MLYLPDPDPEKTNSGCKTITIDHFRLIMSNVLVYLPWRIRSHPLWAQFQLVLFSHTLYSFLIVVFPVLLLFFQIIKCKNLND
jgi:hypothetical protein